MLHEGFCPWSKTVTKVYKTVPEAFLSLLAESDWLLDSRCTLSAIVRCCAWHYGSRKELWHCWDWAYFQGCFEHWAQLSSKWAAAAHSGSLFTASRHCALKLLGRLCVRVVTGGVKHEVMNVRVMTLQRSTAASLALLGPAGCFFYISALQMGEITRLAKYICVCMWGA